jgi:hypothetical protein
MPLNQGAANVAPFFVSRPARASHRSQAIATFLSLSRYYRSHFRSITAFNYCYYRDTASPWYVRVRLQTDCSKTPSECLCTNMQSHNLNRIF